MPISHPSKFVIIIISLEFKGLYLAEGKNVKSNQSIDGI